MIKFKVTQIKKNELGQSYVAESIWQADSEEDLREFLDYNDKITDKDYRVNEV